MRQLKIYNNDIKVLGRVVSIASENKVAAAEQIFDEDFEYNKLKNYSFDNDNIDVTKKGLDQYSINRLIGKKMLALELAGIIPDEDGWINNIKVKNLTVGDTITTKNLNVTENAYIKKLNLNNNITDVEANLDAIHEEILGIKKVIRGDDQSNAIWEAINSLRSDLNGLRSEFEACCAEVKNMINNIPIGGGDASFNVNPKTLTLTRGGAGEQITVTKGSDLTGTVEFNYDSNKLKVTRNSDGAFVEGISATDETTITVSVAGFAQTQNVVVKVVEPAPTEYTVTFDPANGGQSSTVQVEAGKTVSRPTDPTYTGKLFGGWYLGNDQFSFSTPITSDITLVAHWVDEAVAPRTIVITGLDRIPTGEKTTYSAQIVPSNASVDTEITWSVASGEGSINASTGEYTAPDTAQEVEIKATAANGVSQTKRVEIYVTEVPVEYVTVTFDTDGGTPAIADQRIEKGTKATQPSAPIKQGHTFLEWRTVNAGNGFEAGHVWDFSNDVTEDIALKAFYNENAPDPVPVNSVTIDGPSTIKASIKTEDGISVSEGNGSYTAVFNDDATTGKSVKWYIVDNNDDTNILYTQGDGQTAEAMMETYGYIVPEGNLPDTALYVAPYNKDITVTILAVSENGTKGKKVINVVQSPDVYTVSWSGDEGAGISENGNYVDAASGGSAQIEEGEQRAFWVGSMSEDYELDYVEVTGENAQYLTDGSARVYINGAASDVQFYIHTKKIEKPETPVQVIFTEGPQASIFVYRTNNNYWYDLSQGTVYNSFFDAEDHLASLHYGDSFDYAQIRPNKGYTITDVTFEYDGEAAENPHWEFGDGVSIRVYVDGIKSDTRVIVHTEPIDWSKTTKVTLTASPAGSAHVCDSRYKDSYLSDDEGDSDYIPLIQNGLGAFDVKPVSGSAANYTVTINNVETWDGSEYEFPSDEIASHTFDDDTRLYVKFIGNHASNIKQLDATVSFA